MSAIQSVAAVVGRTAVVYFALLLGLRLTGKREGVDEDMLAAALREHGVADMADVEVAVLEVDGSISVVTTSAGTKRIKKPLRFLTHR